MAGCDDTRQLTEQQRVDGYQNQRTGVVQAVRPFTGKTTPETRALIDYINRELYPAVKATRSKLNDVFLQVADNAPSGNPLSYYFSTNTANADPTAGRVRLDNATQDLATTIRVSEDNGRLADAAPWLDVMSGGPTTPLGVVTLTDAINPSRFIRFDLSSMIDRGAYWDLTVVPIESSHDNPFVDGGAIAIGFIPGVGGTTAATVPPAGLSPLAGLSVLGRSASTTGVMAAITATARRQVLNSGTAGTSVGWGAPGTIMPLAPIYDVMASPYNATGDGVADDTTAIQAAIDACEATGGIVALGRAHMITSTLVISGDGVWVRGRGIHPNNGTKIAFNGAGTSCKAVQFLGFQHSGISDCYIESSKVYTADALLEFDGTFRGFAVNLSLTFGYNSIHIYRSTETWVSWFQIRNPFGTRAVLFDGTNAVHSYRCILETAGMDCPYPFAISGHGAAWTAANAVVVGSIRHNTDGIWSCSQAGTTSGAGTGPAKSSIGTTNPTTYRATDVTDGTAKWRWVCDRNLTWVTLDSYASTLTVSKLALISGGIGIRHSNTTGGSSARGDGIIATDLEIDHAYDFGIFLEDGYDAQFHSGTVTSTQLDAGIRVGASYGVDWTFEGLRIFGNAQAGVSLAASYGKVQNNRIGHNGTLTSNTYDGVSIDDGVGHFEITGNIIGELGYTGNAQRTGVQINGTLGDNYCVTGNVLVGNLTNPVFNGPGAATTRVVRNNVPDTTTGIIPDADYGDITVTSTGTVWTIDAGVVTSAKLRNSGALSVIGRSANSSGVPADISATAASGAVLRESGSVLGFGTVATAGIADANVTLAKLANLAAGTTIGRDSLAGTGVPKALTGVQLGGNVKFDTFLQITNAPATINDQAVDDGVKLIRVAVSSAGDLEITGFAFSAGNTGTLFLLFKQGATGRLVLKHGTGSSANNQLVLPNSTDFVMAAANDCVLVQYIGGRFQVVHRVVNTGSIEDAAVTSAKLRNSGALSVIGRSANSSGVPADISATAATDSVLRESGSVLGFGTIVAGGIASNAVTTAKILDANVTLAKQADLAQSTIVGRAEGAGTGVPTALTPTQVVSIIDAETPFWTGAHEWAAAATFRASVRVSTVASATLAAQQDNFTAGATTVCRFTLTGSQSISGIVPNSTSEGCLMLVVNADDTDNLTLLHNNASSTNTNRFFLPGNTDRTLIPRAMALLFYDVTDGRWHMAYAT